MLGTHRRQHSKGLFIFFVQALAGPLRLMQRDRPHRAGSHFKSIVLTHTGRRTHEGLFAT
jgi:hypothetical protein